MSKISKQKVSTLVRDLEQWFEANPYHGYDPYDIKGHSYIIPLQRRAFTRKATNLIIEIFPGISRKMLGIKPTINFKGLALLAHANLLRHRTTGDERYLNNAESYLDFLISEDAGDGSWSGWGYPFDWQSKIFIPAYTPSVVVSVFVGESMLRHRAVTGNAKYDHCLAKISNFIVTQLNIREENTGICFSYTPLDDFYVHNANLFATYFLMETGKIFNNNTWQNLGRRALSYTLSDQHENGSFSYWGSNHQLNHIDNFHTGYVLRMLNRVNEIEPSDVVGRALDSGVKYYLNELFANNMPLHSLNRPFPIDIHTLNEVLMLYSELVKYRPILEHVFTTTLTYLINHMHDGNMNVHYKHYRLFKNRFPFFRWSQAWTYYTLALLENEDLI